MRLLKHLVAMETCCRAELRSASGTVAPSQVSLTGYQGTEPPRPQPAGLGLLFFKAQKRLNWELEVKATVTGHRAALVGPAETGTGLAASPLRRVRQSRGDRCCAILPGDSTSMEGLPGSRCALGATWQKHAHPSGRSLVTGRLARQQPCGSFRWRALGSAVTAASARSQGIPLRTYICYFYSFPGLLRFQHAFCFLFAGGIAFVSFGPCGFPPPPLSFLSFFGGDSNLMFVGRRIVS